MNDTRQAINYVSKSVFKLINGSITEKGFAKLEEVLIHDEVARTHYYELIYVSIALKNAEGVLSFEEILNFDMDLWQEMAEFEKTAPVLEIPKEKPPRELTQKVVYPPREKQKVSKFSLVFLVINAAAILFFILFLWIAPSKQLIEVATLSDSMNAKWADIYSSIQNGYRFVATPEKLTLKKGLVELTFDNHTRAVIEAPAEFQILADDRIGLTYGKVYVMVPPGAIGFSVYTPNTKIIDLGTEFGVQVDAGGDTRLHVLKGKTSLISGRESNRTSIEVVKNTAKRISGVTKEISDIPYKLPLPRFIDGKDIFRFYFIAQLEIIFPFCRNIKRVKRHNYFHLQIPFLRATFRSSEAIICQSNSSALFFPFSPIFKASPLFS